MNLFFILSILGSWASADIIRTEPAASYYTTVGLLPAGDVYFSTCPISKYPQTACDPSGVSTLGISRAVFEKSLEKASDFDVTSIQTREQIKETQQKLEWSQSELRGIEAKLSGVEERVKGIKSQIALIDQQISDVEKRLQNPDLSAHDREELEKFLQTSKESRSSKYAEIDKAMTELSALKKQKDAQLKNITELTSTLSSQQAALAERKTEIEKASVELLQNLDPSITKTTYLKETLFFLSGYMFTDEKAVPDSKCKVTDFALIDGLGTAKGTVHLDNGVFPLVPKKDFQKLDRTVTEVTLTTTWANRKENWLSGYIGDPKVLFQFQGPRGHKDVKCVNQKKDFPGFDDAFYRHTVVNNFNTGFYFAGKFKGQEAKGVCSGISHGHRRNGGNENDPRSFEFIFGHPFGNTDEGQASFLLDSVIRWPMARFIYVKNTPPLADGYYAWADDEGKSLYHFRYPERVERVRLPNELKDVPFPTICTDFY
jgi:predicted  nucleic acid-binding Zn-ribbon protein